MTIEEIIVQMGPIYKAWSAKDAEEAKKNSDFYKDSLELLSSPSTGERIKLKRAKNKWPGREEAFKGFE